MLTTTSRTTRARSLPASHPLARPSVHQCRGFRFGPWGSADQDPDLHRDARKRHRTIRYRYIESLNRRLSWDNQAGLEDTKAALKKAMSDVIRSAAVDGTRVAHVKDVGNAKPDDFAGLRPGRNIEDVERDALDHLFRSNKDKADDAPIKTPLSNIRKYLKTQRTPRDVTPGEVLRATAVVDDPDSIIDPITNRRVPRDTSFTPKTEDVDVHTNPARQNEDDFPDDAHKYGPVQWNEPDGLPEQNPEEQSKKYNDLSKYRAPEQSTDSAEKPKYDDLGDYKPVKWNEPDGLQKPTAEEESKNYNDLDKYKPTKYDDPNAPRKLTPEEESKQYKDLKNYKASTWNEPDGLQEPTPEELSKNYADLDKYEGAVRWNEPDGLQQKTPEELSKNYNDLDKYGAVRWNEPDGLQQQTPEELSKNYNDLDKYGAVRWNEPDGLQKPTAEELSKNYGDLDQYGPVRWNEPDGLQKETPEEASKHYTDLGEYKPVAWNEPDGLRRLTPEELSKEYEDLQAYDGPRVASNSVLQAYAKSQLDTTPKGQVLPSKVEVAAEDPGREYNDLDKYGPVRWNEPDGLQKPTPEELSKNYDDLHLYGAVRWNEPDGLRIPTPEEESKAYKDVHLYSAASPEAPSRVHPEEASKAYTDLGSYGPVRWNEPDGLRKLTPEEQSKAYSDLPAYAASREASARRHPEELSKEYKDLDKYAKFENNAAITRVHPEEASKQYEDLDKYEPQSFDSPSEPYATTASLDGTLKQYDDLARYDPQQFDSASTSYPVHPEQATKDYTDLDRYAAAEEHAPNGSSGTVYTPPRDPRPSMEHSHYGTLETGKDETGTLDRLTAREVRADVQKEKKDQGRLEQAKVEHEKSWDAASEDAQNALKQAKSSSAQSFTGNYARDFPEDFSASWSTENSPSKKALFPDSPVSDSLSSPLPGIDASAKDAELSSMDESFPSPKLESALDRHISGQGTLRRRKFEADPYSTAPQGLETSYEQECAGLSTWPTTVKHYGASSGKGSSDGSEAVGSETPKVYKVLAYDWKVDAVRVAETSSGVDSDTPPLTPAEVITRLSNPSKFFPYFAPLESQGYEIVSGTGDVLVFHRVREPSASPLPLPPTVSTAPTETTDSAVPKPAAVNPIDMMGKPPITGNFASPTGFVNYDNVTERAHKPAPPFLWENETSPFHNRPTVTAKPPHQRNAGRYRGRQDGQAPREKGKFKFLVKVTAASVVSLYGVGLVLNWLEKVPSHP